jgi:hypothetical protein
MALKKLASSSSSFVQNLRQQLMRVWPFSKMAIADVDYFLRYSIEAYFAPGETLYLADGVLKDLYLIFQSRISGRRLILGFEEMGLECAVRHQAASDALATCELLLRLWEGIKKEASSFQELKNLAKQGAWIARG